MNASSASPEIILIKKCCRKQEKSPGFNNEKKISGIINITKFLRWGILLNGTLPCFPLFMTSNSVSIPGCKYIGWLCILRKQRRDDAGFYCCSHIVRQSITGQLFGWYLRFHTWRDFLLLKLKSPTVAGYFFISNQKYF